MRQRRLEEIVYWRQWAVKQTEELDSLIEKITTSEKVKEALKRPINVCKDYATHWQSFLLHNHIVYKLDNKYQDKDGMICSLLQKACGIGKKSGFKKIQDAEDLLQQKDENSREQLKSFYERRYGYR